MNATLDIRKSEDLAALRREAALAGPGLAGRREPAGDAARLALARRFAEHGEIPPVYVLADSRWTDRRAKLFEAGHYEDKGLAVTEAHLAALAAGFEAPVPVLIEHAASPLELGYLTGVEHVGAELFGTVALSHEADALLRSCGASSLSVALSPDLARLVEVSVVRSPRVADARLFAAKAEGEEIRFEAALPAPEPPPGEFAGSGVAPDDDAALARLLDEGRLFPSQMDAARRLLAEGRAGRGGGGPHFDADSGGIRALLVDLLRSRPPSALFSDLAPDPGALSGEAGPSRAETDAAAAELLLPEEAAFYRRHFPGVSLGEIAKRRSRR